MMVEALFIKLLSDEDAAFQSMYRRFVRNYEKYEMVVLDLQNRSVTRRQSAMLFGRLLVEKQYGVVFFEHFRMEDVEEICHGIDDVYMKRFPKGLVNWDGEVITRPGVVVALPDEGQELAMVQLEEETQDLIACKTTKCSETQHINLIPEELMPKKK